MIFSVQCSIIKTVLLIIMTMIKKLIHNSFTQKVLISLYFRLNACILATVLFNLKQYVKVIGRIVRAKRLGKKIIVFYLGENDQENRFKNFEKAINLLEQNQTVEIFVYVTNASLAKQLTDRTNIYYFRYFFCPRAIYADVYLTLAQVSMPIGPLFSKKIQFYHAQASVDQSFGSTFDEYDYVFCSGKQQLTDFKQLFNYRELNGKCLITGGYLKLDRLIKDKVKSTITENNVVVIYAPTAVSYNASNEINGILQINTMYSLQTSGFEIIKSLLDSDYKVIFRPHPGDLKEYSQGYPYVKRILNTYKGHPQLFFDDSKDYFETYQSSALMISDISGTAFTYAYVFEKPVILFLPNQSDLSIDVENLSSIGYPFGDRCETLVHTTDDLKIKVKDILENPEVYRERVVNFRDDNLFNFGCSSEYLAKNIDYVLNDTKHPDWEYL